MQQPGAFILIPVASVFRYYQQNQVIDVWPLDSAAMVTAVV